MSRTLVGKISSLWRYPVKSTLGEEIISSLVTSLGLLGDRGYALLDIETGKVASAKFPKKWSSLLNFHASYADIPSASFLLPEVNIILPNGQKISSKDSQANKIISDLLGREVQLICAPPESACIDQYWPSVEGTAHQDALTQIFMPEGTFFDSCFIHLITQATLARLQELSPESEFKAARFRPNVIISPTSNEIDFIENDWVGGILFIGEEVKLSIDTVCPRCVVTTLAQGDLSNDLNVLHTTAKYNDVIAGIRTSVLQTGSISLNDPIWLEK